jgi:hypothetical protein
MEHGMKNLKIQSRFAAFLLLMLGGCIAAFAQITPSGDAYTSTATPTTNLGTKPLLDIESASQTSYIQFDLSSIPSGYSSASIAKATLKLYVNAVTTAGSFNVDHVNGTWSEKTITADLAPALGTTIVSSVPLTSANVHDYILIDITPALGAWLDGTEPNDGIALVANSPLNASFDSKENTTNSHPPELDIVFAGGGTISGVTTASGSGLTGGGTRGMLNLGLTNTCAAHQVLQWNGSSWACSAAGTGTITGVNPGTGLLGGGTSGTVTLNLDTTKIPQLTGNNNFSGNESIAGGVLVGATGTPLATLDVASSQHTLIGNMGCIPSLFAGIAFGASSATGCLNYSMLGDGGNTYLNRAAGGSILFREGNANEMVLAPGGNLGIGTSSPQYSLHVNGTMRSELGLSLGGNAPLSVDAPGVPGGRFAVLANGNVVAPGGNVGIGTTAPSSPLTVVSSNTYVPALFQDSSTFGTWLELNNTSAGGHNWAILSAGSANAEGAGNLGITNFTGNSNIYLEGNIKTNSLSINSDTPMSSNPHMAFSGFLVGNLGSSPLGGYFIPDRNIIITRISATEKSAGHGCSTDAFAELYDHVQQTVIAGIDLGPNQNYADSGPAAIPVPGGTQIAIQGVAASGCNITGQSPSDVYVTVQYVMQ